MCLESFSLTVFPNNKRVFSPVRYKKQWMFLSFSNIQHIVTIDNMLAIMKTIWSILKPNAVSNDGTCEIWSRLVNWPRRYSPLKECIEILSPVFHYLFFLRNFFCQQQRLIWIWFRWFVGHGLQHPAGKFGLSVVKFPCQACLEIVTVLILLPY